MTKYSCLLTFLKILQPQIYKKSKVRIPGCMIFPGGYLISNSLLSKCFITNSKPHKASVSPMLCVQYRSEPFLVKRSCSASLRTTTTSPGSSPGYNSNSSYSGDLTEYACLVCTNIYKMSELGRFDTKSYI